MDAITITRSKILIVEGNDPYRFFIKLLLHLQIDGVQVIDFGGNDELRKKLIALPNIPGFNSVNKLAIIRDAEESNPKNILSSISDALRKNNILCPEILNVFQENNGIHIGIFLLPDNIKEGMLEDLCIMSIEDSPEMVCINEFLNCAKLVPTPPSTPAAITFHFAAGWF
jgi:hypothetical protein